MKKETVDEIVGRALRGEPYVPTGGGDDAPAQPAAPPGVAYAELTDAEIEAIALQEIGFDGGLQQVNGMDIKSIVRAAERKLASNGQAPAGATGMAAEIVELLGCSGCLKANTQERALATVSRILSAQHGGAL